MNSKNISFSAIQPFRFFISYHPPVLPREYNDSHIHPQCEIYVHGSGRVSFMVEGQLYPIQRGDAIITRPYEYHHCVYREKGPHEHYWILFDAEGNEALLPSFFHRPAGSGNRIVPERPEELLALCRRLTEKSSPAAQYRDFFALLSLLEQGATPRDTALPNELQQVLDTINEQFNTSLRIEELARANFISVNTLERQFKDHLGVTPSEYLRQKRLAHAASLLEQGFSVSKAAAESGWNDPSRFITLFKKSFGTTPFQYKKR